MKNHIFIPQQNTSSINGASHFSINKKLINEILLNSATGVTAHEVVISLPNNVVVSLTTRLIEKIGDGEFIWHGYNAHINEIQCIISIAGWNHKEQVFISGHIHYLKDDFFIKSTKENEVKIGFIHHKHIKCGTKEKHKNDLFIKDSTIFYNDENESIVVPGKTQEKDVEMPIIDMLFLYPSTTLDDNLNQIKSKVNLAKGVIDGIFVNSGINARINVVAVEECEFLTKKKVKDLLSEVVYYDKTGSDKQGPAYQKVLSLRKKYHADIVALLSPESSDSTVGIAIRTPEPPRSDSSNLFYSTLAVYYGYENFSYAVAHELGHLLGGIHDRTTQPIRFGGKPEFDYAHGYIPASKEFVTIMGYPSNDDYKNNHYEHIPAYSSADKTWNGKKIGIPMGEPGAADAASLFRLTTKIVANYAGDPSPLPQIEINTEVEPQLGGFIIPAVPGPYTKDSHVAVTAFPRSGYEFSQWEYNEEKTHLQKIMVKVNDNVKLKAVFKIKNNSPKLTMDKACLDKYKDDFQFILPEKVEPGMDTTVRVHFKTINYPALDWVINGKETKQSVISPLKFIFEEDTIISVKENHIAMVIDKTDYRIRINNTTEYQAILCDSSYQMIRNKEVLVTLPKGLTLKNNPIKTDENGVATLTIHTDDSVTEGELYTIKFSLGNDVAYGYVKATSRFCEPHGISDRKRFIQKNNKPDDIKFTLFSKGVSFPSKEIELTLMHGNSRAMDNEQKIIKQQKIKTNEKGVATIQFNNVVDGMNGRYYVVITIFEEDTTYRIVTDDFFVDANQRKIGLDVLDYNDAIAYTKENIIPVLITPIDAMIGSLTFDLYVNDLELQIKGVGKEDYRHICIYDKNSGVVCNLILIHNPLPDNEVVVVVKSKYFGSASVKIKGMKEIN